MQVNHDLTSQHGVEFLVIVLGVMKKPLDVFVAQLELLLIHGHILIRPDEDEDNEDEDEIVEDIIVKQELCWTPHPSPMVDVEYV